ncbi:hypothetical protein NE850_23060 [Paraburkholderia sp. USG1]|uniref:hypothetical protein n=1 Tax=Paraburkholderia sp. USG1 TaxID=2952268 RepID=UPI002864F5C7|nr:hypothetical protein [Paraburkholderia sp. USG1]MDR8399205.1 hypothetical protein [Paraburkholderia sp. USG1]
MESLEAGTTCLKLPFVLKQRMGERSRKSGVNQSEIIRRGIAMYLDDADRIEQQIAQLIAPTSGGDK